MSNRIPGNWITNFRRLGFWLERGFLSPEEVQRINRLGAMLLAEREEKWRIVDPHRGEPAFLPYYRHPKLIARMKEIFGELPVGIQTMYYVKAPQSPGHSWHQDQFYIPGDPQPVMAAWCALDKVDEANGALMVFPGTHTGPILPMVPCDDPRFAHHRQAVQPPAGAQPLAVCMQPGDVLFFHGCLIHGALPNTTTDRHRRAWICHYLAEHSTGQVRGQPNRELTSMRGGETLPPTTPSGPDRITTYDA